MGQRDDVLAADAGLAGSWVWDRVQEELLTELREGDYLDLSRTSIDSASIRAKKGGESTGPNPTVRAKAGTKHHIVCDKNGVLLTCIITGANVNDTTTLETLVDAIPPIRGKRGRPLRRPKKIHADKAYDSRKNRLVCRKRNITPRIARRGKDSSSRLGKHRWVVERTFCLAPFQQAPHHSLRATRRYPPRPPQTRLPHDRLQHLGPEGVLLGALITVGLHAKQSILLRFRRSAPASKARRRPTRDSSLTRESLKELMTVRCPIQGR